MSMALFLHTKTSLNTQTSEERKREETVENMESSVKFFCVLVFIGILSFATMNVANATGECPKSSPDMEAMKLIPCASAAQDSNAPVSSSCCAQVKQMGRNPKCMCAVLMSNTAKSSGVKPEIAITIPKRCNFADRPIGYKCGPYTLP